MAKKVDTLIELGFAPVVVKAKRKRNTHTITVVSYNPERNTLTLKLGDDVLTHFGEAVDVYANVAGHLLALRPTTGANTDISATIKGGKITFINPGFDASYLQKATYPVEWNDADQYVTLTLNAQAVAVETPEEVYA